MKLVKSKIWLKELPKKHHPLFPQFVEFQFLLEPHQLIGKFVVLLAIVGGTGATIGRFFLKKISGLFRKFVGEEQQSNLDTIGNY